MEDYIILKTNDIVHSFVCFVKTTEDVDFLIDDIKNDMIKLGIKKIMIDLFLTNGYAFNRFFDYDIDRVDTLSIVNPRCVSGGVNNVINNYLFANKNLLEMSALSIAMRGLVVKQLSKVKTN